MRGPEGLDLLYANRPLARRVLALASKRETPIGRMRIISVEGLLGFRDLDDICALVKVHRTSLNMDGLREYFSSFHKAELLHELVG